MIKLDKLIARFLCILYSQQKYSKSDQSRLFCLDFGNGVLTQKLDSKLKEKQNLR